LCDSQLKTAIIFLNRINQLSFVMVKYGVLFEVKGKAVPLHAMEALGGRGGTDGILKYYLNELRLQGVEQYWPVALCDGEVWCSP
jgi:hypothetical protein